MLAVYLLADNICHLRGVFLTVHIKSALSTCAKKLVVFYDSLLSR